MTDFRIRRAGAEDADVLSLVGGAAFLETFTGILPGPNIVAHCVEKLSAEAFRQRIDAGAQAWLVEDSNSQAPLGYALVAAPDFPFDTAADDLELRRIYLLRRAQGQGAAALLLDRVVDALRSDGTARLILGVYKGNVRAHAFYKKHGFVVIGERQYRVGADSYDDWVYALDLRER